MKQLGFQPELEVWTVWTLSIVALAPFGRGSRVKTGTGEKPISGMCVQPNIFHSILIFVPTHLGVDLKYRNT